IGRLGTWRAMRYVLAKQPALDEAGVCPCAVLEQRRLSAAAFAGLLPPVERRDDRGIKGGGAGVVAHAGYGACRLGIRRGSYHVHQTRSSPIDGGVKAGSGSFLALLAVGRERGVDEPRVKRQQIRGSDLQALPHGEREVGDEDVGRL